MMLSDWKAVDEIETLIDSHHSGHMPATELLGDIAAVLHKFGYKNSQASLSYLVGQVHGKLHGLIEKSSTESVRHDLIVLFDHIAHVVNELYYKPEDKNEKIEV